MKLFISVLLFIFTFTSAYAMSNLDKIKSNNKRIAYFQKQINQLRNENKALVSGEVKISPNVQKYVSDPVSAPVSVHLFNGNVVNGKRMYVKNIDGTCAFAAGEVLYYSTDYINIWEWTALAVHPENCSTRFNKVLVSN